MAMSPALKRRLFTVAPLACMAAILFVFHDSQSGSTTTVSVEDPEEVTAAGDPTNQEPVAECLEVSVHPKWTTRLCFDPFTCSGSVTAARVEGCAARADFTASPETDAEVRRRFGPDSLVFSFAGPESLSVLSGRASGERCSYKVDFDFTTAGEYEAEGRWLFARYEAFLELEGREAHPFSLSAALPEERSTLFRIATPLKCVTPSVKRVTDTPLPPCTHGLGKGRWVRPELVLERPKWQPHDCEHRAFGMGEIRQCLRKRSILLVGDAVLHALYRPLARTVVGVFPAGGAFDTQSGAEQEAYRKPWDTFGDASVVRDGVQLDFSADPTLLRLMLALAGKKSYPDTEKVRQLVPMWQEMSKASVEVSALAAREYDTVVIGIGSEFVQSWPLQDFRRALTVLANLIKDSNSRVVWVTPTAAPLPSAAGNLLQHKNNPFRAALLRDVAREHIPGEPVVVDTFYLSLGKPRFADEVRDAGEKGVFSVLCSV
eukprot:TRINITY_DN19276_c0_g1_i2.p1 TRINITY_DN19276_c0_g1~~TRINITY_DN19276_c0_g1_i2.p1  ORF type:complete len:488 (+),score=77.83 TRINITY_DN19276_c0_g1_i2:84-1547(+)